MECSVLQEHRCHSFTHRITSALTERRWTHPTAQPGSRGSSPAPVSSSRSIGGSCRGISRTRWVLEKTETCFFISSCRVSVVDRDVLTPGVRETRVSFLTARSAANQEYAVLDAGERRLWRPRGWPCATARRRAGQYLQLLLLNVILFAPRGPPSSTRSPRCEALRHDGPAYSPARPPPAVEARADSYATVWGRSPRGRRGQWQA